MLSSAAFLPPRQQPLRRMVFPAREVDLLPARQLRAVDHRSGATNTEVGASIAF
jgi:hypothetical protein